ncbi:hypothetical protein AMATHDRAFT_48061 [Amanita thiersii Skay4041]|uniref:BTB domain-containing protein n=1 Tax=Amanita thiersii Skay4041 TaxID=703135 RepID=A0A2A9NI15_9AGAR|nr:hypothetical protein AMATHDRAFT_48061 [Amanita thiersii Skay4041]
MGPEWDSVAVKAAENTLEIPLSSLPSCPELSWMTGGDLYHYVTWRLGRESQNSRSSYRTHTIRLILRTPPSPGDSNVVTRTTTDSDHLAKLFEISAGTDVILRSSDTVDFFVSERFLRLALPAFASIISSGSVGENGVKVIAVPETSHTLRHLLLILYNCIDTPGVNDGELFFEMGHTIQKYSLQFIESKLRLTLRSSPIMTKEPLRAFSIATLFGWTEEAKSAAVNTLGTALESLRYCSELERIKGADFFRLLEHRFKCVEVVGELITSNECTSPGDLIGNSGTSYPLSSSIKAKIQGILKQCPQGNAIRESTFLNIRVQRKTNDWSFEKSYKTLADVIEEAVIKVTHLISYLLIITDKWVWVYCTV